MKNPVPAVNGSSASVSQPCHEELLQMRSLLNASVDIICSVNAKGRFVYVSAAAQEVWGYTPQELVGKRYMELVIPGDHQETEATAAAVMSGVAVTSFENHYTRKDGSVVPILWSARWCESEQIMYCVAKDATQIKRADEQKAQLTRRLNSAYQLAEIAWWEYDVSTQIYTCSGEIFTMYGLAIPDNCQMALDEFIGYVHPEDRPRLQHDLSVICQDTYVNYEHRIVKPGGNIIYVIHFAEVIRDEKGCPVFVHGTTKDITRRKLQQLKVEESEKRLQQYSHQLTEIVESIGDGFFTVDKEWTVTYWNRKAEELLGKRKEDIVGKNLWQEYESAMPLKFYTEYHRAVKEGIAVQFEEYFPLLNMWIEVAAYPSGDGLTVYFKDVTEKKRQEEALQLANERFALVAKATSDALWDWDVTTNACYFNEGFTTLFGHENKADFVYKNWLDNIHEDDLNEVVNSILYALDDVTVNQWQGEYRFYRLDRTVACVLDRGYIIRNKDGKAVRMVGSMQDITKLKETEEEIQRLSLVAKETVNAVVMTDDTDRITWVNKAFTDITEYSLDEAKGKRPGELLQGPGTSEKTKRYLNKCVEKRLPFSCEILNYTKSGREYWMEIKGQPIFNKKGELQQFFAIQTDITARKENEAIIELSEKKYKLLFYSSPRPIYIFNAETLQVIDVNHAACELYGYSKEEFMRLRIQDLKLPEDEPELLMIVQTLKSRRSSHFQKIVRHKKKTGELFSIELASFPIQLPTGMHLLVTGTDMTEKLQLQKQLINEKVEAQKQIARAIIRAQETERSEIGRELHDNVCQLLTTAKLYIENSRHFPTQQNEFTQKGVELLMQSINEIRYLSRQLVSPVTNDTSFEASINELICHYRSMNLFDICFTYQANIELLDKDLKTSIIRILQEQFNNTVKYANASLVKLCISNTDDLLLLHYADNGVGFDPATAKKGIGLTNISNRASAYRGAVKMTAAIGEGCQMQVTFPLSPNAGFISSTQTNPN